MGFRHHTRSRSGSIRAYPRPRRPPGSRRSGCRRCRRHTLDPWRSILGAGCSRRPRHRGRDPPCSYCHRRNRLPLDSNRGAPRLRRCCPGSSPRRRRSSARSHRPRCSTPERVGSGTADRRTGRWCRDPHPDNLLRTRSRSQRWGCSRTRTRHRRPWCTHCHRHNQSRIHSTRGAAARRTRRLHTSPPCKHLHHRSPLRWNSTRPRAWEVSRSQHLQ